MRSTGEPQKCAGSALAGPSSLTEAGVLSSQFAVCTYELCGHHNHTHLGSTGLGGKRSPVSTSRLSIAIIPGRRKDFVSALRFQLNLRSLCLTMGGNVCRWTWRFAGRFPGVRLVSAPRRPEPLQPHPRILLALDLQLPDLQPEATEALVPCLGGQRLRRGPCADIPGFCHWLIAAPRHGDRSGTQKRRGSQSCHLGQPGSRVGTGTEPRVSGTCLVG